MANFLEIALLWPPKKADTDCVAAGVIHIPCAVILKPGDTLAVFKIPAPKDPDKRDTAPSYVLKMTQEDRHKGASADKGTSTGRGGFSR